MGNLSIRAIDPFPVLSGRISYIKLVLFMVQVILDSKPTEIPQNHRKKLERHLYEIIYC